MLYINMILLQFSRFLTGYQMLLFTEHRRVPLRHPKTYNYRKTESISQIFDEACGNYLPNFYHYSIPSLFYSCIVSLYHLIFYFPVSRFYPPFPTLSFQFFPFRTWFLEIAFVCKIDMEVSAPMATRELGRA